MLAAFVRKIECRRVPNQSNSTGVSVYRSSDLVNWKFEGRFCRLVLAVSLCHTSLSGDVCIVLEKKGKISLFSDHNGSLRRQPRAHCTCACQRGATP